MKQISYIFCCFIYFKNKYKNFFVKNPAHFKETFDLNPMLLCSKREY